MSDQLQQPIINMPAIHLLYSASVLPMPDKTIIAARMAAINNKEHQGSGEIEITWSLQDSQKCLGQIRFGDHSIQVAGLSTSLPQVIIDRTINVSHWQPQIKAAMRQHRSHLSLVYTGIHPDPTEKMTALYSAAHAFDNENLLGVVNEGAWTAHPPADFLNPERIATYRKDIPFILWVGYVRLYIDKLNYWLVTKGHHVFDVPDLAYLVQPEEDPDEIISHFINIFYFLYEKDVAVTAGDTLEISGTGENLRFSEVTEHADFLMGPSGTLVIEKIHPDQTNPKD